MSQRPTCAICDRPLADLQRCVLIGTEAVHRTCATSGNPTKLSQVTQAIAKLEVDVATLRRMAHSQQRDIKRAEADALSITSTLATARQANAVLSNTLLAAEDQRRAAMAECERLRARIAELEAPPRATVAVDVVDAAEARFGLLEFD